MAPAESEESLAVPPPRDLALLAIAMAGVSGSGPIMAATAAPALAIAFWRNAFGAAFAGLSALAVRWARRTRVIAGPAARVDRRTLATAGLGGIFLALHFATWVPSVKFTAVASATALVSTQAVFSALIAAARGRTLPRAAWFGMGVAILGTALIAGADFEVSLRALTGDALAIIGGVFAAAYVSAGSVARRTMSATSYTTVCYSVCAVILVVVCLVGRQSLSGYPARAWFLIAGVTVCGQLLGHTLINVVLRSASATFVGLAILTETPGAAVIAAVWLHQTPTIWAVPGLVMLLAGLVITVRARPAHDLTSVDVD